MIDLTVTDRGTLEHLLRFYAESGLDFAIEAQPVDHFAQLAAADTPSTAPVPTPQPAPPQVTPQSTAPRAAAPPVVVPDDQAVSMARKAAAAAIDLDALKAAVEAFEGCNLKRSARHTIFEGGDRKAPIMLVWAAPSRDDDRTGEALSGLDGMLLGKMLAAIGIDHLSDTYGGFCVPWAVPGGERPTPLHLKICAPFVERQIALAQPKLVVALGNAAAQHLMETRQPITRMHGQWLERTFDDHACQVTALFEPALLREQPRLKRLAWLDLLAIKKSLDEAA